MVVRAIADFWPVALCTLAATSVSIAANLASLPPDERPARLASYPVRLALPASTSLPAAPGTEFDIASAGTLGEGGSTIEIRKRVWLNGGEAGSATIRVNADSTLAISTAELGRLLDRAGLAEVAERVTGQDRSAAFVGFEELRLVGIEVRYDTAADRVLVGG